MHAGASWGRETTHEGWHEWCFSRLCARMPHLTIGGLRGAVNDDAVMGIEPAVS